MASKTTTQDLTFPDVDFDALSNLKTPADAAAWVAAQYGEMEKVNPFPLVRDKVTLIGTKFVVLHFSERIDKDTNNVYSNVLAMDDQGNRFAFNDGGTGIHKQLQEYYSRTGKSGGLLAESGLRRSEYTTEINGKTEKAVTYYLS